MRSIVFAGVGALLVACCIPACSSGDPASSPGYRTSGGDGGTGGEADGGPAATPDAASSPDGAVPPDAPAGPSCTNKKKDGSETDVDCGGSCPERCKLLAACAVAADCVPGAVCVKGTCSAPSATDGMKNGTETDVDCGGNEAPACDVGKACLIGADCKEKVCDGATCAAPLPTDGVKNATETDVDCGGGAPAPACANGLACNAAADCTSLVCTGNVCQAPLPTDGVKNANETDIDCGGGAPAPACVAGKACLDGAQDCTSFVCTGNVCQPPTGTDGVKNGDESDVDCGGVTTGAPRCAAGSVCNAHADCASDGCAFDGRCAIERSCTRQLGGATCGVGEVGQAGAAHESCCAQAPMTNLAARIDKYHVTAGRMRAFIERVGGNVRAFAKTTPGWNAAWDPYVPSTVAEANAMLGSYWNNAPNDADVATNAWSKRSCQPNFFGGHTYFTGDDPDFTASQLDPKALNCVGWHIAKAFCAWDHGRLATRAELVNAFRNAGTTTYPWNWQDNSPFDPTVQDSRLNHEFIYGYPGVPRRVGQTVQNISWFISPPGRFPAGANANGVDIAGNLLHWSNDSEYNFVWTFSWERHGASLSSQNWKNAWPGEPNGYYAIGFRCAHD